MTFLEFAKIAANIKTYFPRDNILPTKEAMKLWFDGVADLDYEAVRIGLQKYSMTNSYPPSLSDLRSFAVHSHTDDPESETHAWNMVYKALGNSGQHAEEEFSKLPEVVQRAVHSPGQLREWAFMDIKTVNSVIYSNFLRAYYAEVAREKMDRNIPPDLKALEREMAERLEQKRKESLSAAVNEQKQVLLENQNADITAERIACEKNASKNPEYIDSLMDKLREKLYGQNRESFSDSRKFL